ncbi:hypothetical protein GLAREA_09205 [Glarea lozoyensis ATCC 20868]|uniref:2EXR domain-containing protein n=1 Tax=Glarea lozoyensis (strain ATCC 20868 / MF5171) TaxID=1116229 RepID=S3DF48_GLAL2|nr:uncharacterized protein GLAREA_09205 [Glarea lozoyensis ATCC 20868]EPE37042.1 hypothetical protein GLAREA_09205 [Glarea lozoyensis ATCC 20868]
MSSLSQKNTNNNTNGFRLAEGDLSTFHCFSKLHIELRLMIWKQACNSPRLVEILYSRRSTEKNPSNTPVPGLLHANRQARLEGLKVYQLLLGYRYKDLRKYKETYMNWEVDHVLLQPDHLHYQGYMKKPLIHADFQKCRHLVLSDCDFYHLMEPDLMGTGWDNPNKTPGYAGTVKLSSLKTLTILMAACHGMWGEKDFPVEATKRYFKNVVQTLRHCKDPPADDIYVALKIIPLFKAKYPEVETRVGILKGEEGYRLIRTRRTKSSNRPRKSRTHNRSH